MDNPLKACLHPFDSFYDIRFGNKGSATVAYIILFALFSASVFSRQATGFLFNYNRLSDLNVLMEIGKTKVPFMMWTAGNWCISILMNGTGRYRDIFIVSAYAILPYVASLFAATLISNVLAINEPFHMLITVFGIILSGILLLIGTMVIHEYSFVKNIAANLLSLASMAIILFLFTLFYTLFNQLWAFLYTLFTEFMFRI